MKTRRRSARGPMAVAVALLCLDSIVAHAQISHVRIRTAERGVYELTPADLAAAGVPVSDPGFDPRTLKLAFDHWKPAALLPDSTPASWQSDYRLGESAIWVTGEDDGHFDGEDRLIFYALGPEGWDDLAGPADSLAYSEHPYDRSNYAWLDWGGSAGLRMQQRSVALPAPPQDPVVTRVWHREHREQDLFFAGVGDLLSWLRIRASGPENAVDFDLDLGTDSTATGDLRLQFGDTSGLGATVTVQLNGALLGTTPRLFGNTAPRVAFEHVTLRAHNRLTFQPNNQGSAVFCELDAAWTRPLTADAGGRLEWSEQARAGARVYELQGFGGAKPLVFDVTNDRRVERLTDVDQGPASLWQLHDARSSGQRMKYAAIIAPRRLNPQTDLELHRTAPIRERTSSPDMLIVTHPDLLPAAERLAAYRRQHLPGVTNADVLVTTTQDIYDNFCGGRQDPLAVRNWIKYLYRLSNPSRLAYVLLLGDATRDPRQVLAGTPPTLVPAVHPAYADARAAREFAVEDWFGAMSDLQNNRFVPNATLAVGRLPARSLEEADVMVDKILAYEDDGNIGPWRGRVLMAADDECNPSSGCSEALWTGNAEALAARVPADFDLHKVYLTEYPLEGSQKPTARAALIREWTAGAAVFCYIGRGAIGQLADEVLLLSADVPALTNAGRLPVVLKFHDNDAAFDRPTIQSFAELLVASPVGGAIADIGPTSAVYASPGFNLALRQFQQLFATGGARPQTLGVIHRLAKGTPNQGTESFVLIGDPALLVRLPSARVSFDVGAGQLQTGRRAHVEGFVHMPENSEPLLDFEGLADVEVLGNADESGYRGGDGLVIPYVLPGKPIYRGRVAVHAGRFAVDFTVPPPPARAALLPASRSQSPNESLGPGARIAAYAWSGARDAKGGRDGLVVVESGTPDSSIAPPQIRLAFPGNATRVAASAVLTARLADENGIWIAGVSAPSSIRIQLDSNEPVDITDTYRAEEGSDMSGSFAFPLPSLPAGPHRATVFASDNLGNAATASLEFEVVDTPSQSLAEFGAGPNPTRGSAEFSFVLDAPAEVDLRIFSVDGRAVFHIRQQHDGLRRGLLRWNGKNAAGGDAASGIYFYRLDVHRPGSPSELRTGKLAVLR